MRPIRPLLGPIHPTGLTCGSRATSAARAFSRWTWRRSSRRASIMSGSASKGDRAVVVGKGMVALLDTSHPQKVWPVSEMKLLVEECVTRGRKLRVAKPSE